LQGKQSYHLVPHLFPIAFFPYPTTVHHGATKHSGVSCHSSARVLRTTVTKCTTTVSRDPSACGCSAEGRSGAEMDPLTLVRGRAPLNRGPGHTSPYTRVGSSSIGCVLCCAAEMERLFPPLLSVIRSVAIRRQVNYFSPTDCLSERMNANPALPCGG
jgi:hypothetical protein